MKLNYKPNITQQIEAALLEAYATGKVVESITLTKEERHQLYRSVSCHATFYGSKHFGVLPIFKAEESENKY
jgi:hypothetical protein